MMREIQVGCYVYAKNDPEKKNLLVLSIAFGNLQVFCMKTLNKFYLHTKDVKLTPIWWKGETYD